MVTDRTTSLRWTRCPPWFAAATGMEHWVPGFIMRRRPAPRILPSSDLDGDGALDLIVDSWATSEISVLRGRGRHVR